MTAALLLTGCVGPAPTQTIAQLPNAEQAPELYRPWVIEKYTLQVGDVVKIMSYYDPGLNQETTVRPDGIISLLLLGEVRVLGSSLAALQAMVETEYQKFLPASDVTVSVLEIQGRAVYVGGEVRQPSMQRMNGQLTLLQGVLSAGGFQSTANYRQVVLLRKGENGAYVAYQVDVANVLSKGTPDVYLRDRDIIYVPKTEIARFDEFVDQYLNQIVPRWVQFSFGYQFLNTVGDSETPTLQIGQ